MRVGQKVWYNGATNDPDRINYDGQFHSCKGVDIQSSSIGFSLSKSGNGVSMGSNTTLGDGVALIGYAGDKYHAYKNGIILKNLTSSPYYFQKTTNQDCYNFVNYTLTGGGGAGTTEAVIIGNTKLSRISLGGTSPATSYEDFATLTSPTINNSNYRPATKANTFLYIGRGNCVDVLTPLGVLANGITIDKGAEIRALLTRGDQVVIVTQDSVIFWDGASTAFDSQINYPNYNITNAVMLGSYIYLIAEDGIYDYILLGGIAGQDEPLVKKKKSTVMNFSSITTNQIETIGNTILIPDTTNDGVISYGANFPGMRKALSKAFTNTVGTIKALSYYSGSLYMLTAQSGTNYSNEFDIDTDDTYLTGGWLKTTPFYNEDIKNVNGSVKMVLSATGTTDHSIAVYETRDGNTETLIDTVTLKAGTNTYPINLSSSQWHRVSYRFVLNTSNTTTTPTFHSYYIDFDEKNRQ